MILGHVREEFTLRRVYMFTHVTACLDVSPSPEYLQNMAALILRARARRKKDARALATRARVSASVDVSR